MTPPSSRRSASAVVAKAAKGFHVFRVDGYSQAEKLPGGECVRSNSFTVGGRTWRVELYPNGADGARDESASVSLFLRVERSYGENRGRVRAQYQFSLLDAAGHPAYELPAETAVFSRPDDEERQHGLRRGYDEFITKEALQRRRDSLLKDDSIAIRCDVCVTELNTVAIGGKHGRKERGYGSSSDDSDDDSTDSEILRQKKKARRRLPEPDDEEFVQRCLAERPA